MMTLFIFALGYVIGALFGLFTAALLTAGRKVEEDE